MNQNRVKNEVAEGFEPLYSEDAWIYSLVRCLDWGVAWLFFKCFTDLGFYIFDYIFVRVPNAEWYILLSCVREDGLLYAAPWVECLVWFVAGAAYLGYYVLTESSSQQATWAMSLVNLRYVRKDAKPLTLAYCFFHFFHVGVRVPLFFLLKLTSLLRVTKASFLDDLEADAYVVRKKERSR